MTYRLQAENAEICLRQHLHLGGRNSTETSSLVDTRYTVEQQTNSPLAPKHRSDRQYRLVRSVNAARVFVFFVTTNLSLTYKIFS
jgi:hypothetical protein